MCLKAGKKLFIKFMINNDKKLLKGKKSFGDFNIAKDLNYANDDNFEHNLDILYPPVEKFNGITLLYIHGGAYIYGYKEASRIFCSYFIDKGFKVVAMNYRLGNHKEHVSIIEQVQDAFKAIEYLKQNEREYGLNLNKFALLGDSAGGHISLLVDIIYHSKEAQEFFGIKTLPDVKISCLGLDSPMFDSLKLVQIGKKYITKSTMRDMFGDNYLDLEFVKKYSPRYYFSQKVKLEPLMVNTAYNDIYKEQSMLLKLDAEKLGYNLDYHMELSHKSNIGHVYNHFEFENEGKIANDRLVNFFLKNCC